MLLQKWCACLGVVEEARRAGATVVGAEDLVEAVMGGRIDFDRCIATPDMMSLVGKIARVCKYYFSCSSCANSTFDMWQPLELFYIDEWLFVYKDLGASRFDAKSQTWYDHAACHDGDKSSESWAGWISHK